MENLFPHDFGRTVWMISADDRVISHVPRTGHTILSIGQRTYIGINSAGRTEDEIFASNRLRKPYDIEETTHVCLIIVEGAIVTFSHILESGKMDNMIKWG
jgi:hypothetical protein